MFRKLAAECFGTFWLVFGGCGSAVLAAAFPELGIGFAGVALAFGLTVLTMAFAVGHISGGHFNPAVTLGLWAGGRFPAKEVIGYIIAQVVGGIIAAAVLYVVASGKAGFDAAASGFASNGYGEHSPGGFSMLSAIVIEIVLTCGFLLVIHGATDKHAPAGFAPIAIGLALTPHPFDQHSGYQHLGQPGAQHRGSDFPGRLGSAAAVAVLGHADRRRDPRRRAVSHPAGKT
ncbi:aquaporin Z [Klebsiella variicola]|nr:aquaporin Z [Klebsiella variicola]